MTSEEQSLLSQVGIMLIPPPPPVPTVLLWLLPLDAKDATPVLFVLDRTVELAFLRFATPLPAWPPRPLGFLLWARPARRVPFDPWNVPDPDLDCPPGFRNVACFVFSGRDRIWDTAPISG